ncbi:MAG: dihydrolipoyl dehydrogenase [bacterium]|nr:dihydrolipoyl dehydrogenase [bacterium]
MAETSFDLLVIGAGPGGYVAAIRGAQLGMKVGCIEKESLGGTCLNVGCIPSKALLESSELYEQARTKFKKHGIQTGEVGLDLGAMMKRKDSIVQRMTRGIGGLFKKNQVSHISGTARITGPGKVEVDSGGKKQTLTAARILIATGSRPVQLPNLPFDGEYVLSSTEALALDGVPERLLVIGAGAIGLELGSVWNRLGSEVLVAELMDHIVPGMDKEMGAGLKKLLEKQGIKFRMETKAESCEIRDGKVHLQLKSKTETTAEVCDRVLVAVGRRANTEGLGVEEVGINLDDRGRIAVNPKFETSVSGVYAVGDVIAGPMLAHKAEEEGIAAVEMMAGQAGHVNYDVIPGVVYTYPELASVGLSEEAAAEKGLKVRLGKFPLMANGRAHSLEAADGQVKVISEEGTDRILGVHILAARASEMIAEAVVAMEFCASAEDLARTVHAHPTLPEALKEAALAVDGRAIHM